MKLVRHLVAAACAASLPWAVQAAGPSPLAAATQAVVPVQPVEAVASTQPVTHTDLVAAPVDDPLATGRRTVVLGYYQPAVAEPATPAAQPTPSTQATGSVKQQAATSALADGVSTLGVLSAGGIETNPIMPSSPLGIVLVTAAKMGLASYADGLPDAERGQMLRSMNASFGGAAVNNLLVLMSAANPVSLIAGLAAGAYFWVDTDQKLAAEAEAKANHYRALAAEHHRQTMAIYNSVYVEAHAVNDADIDVHQLAAFDGRPGRGPLQLAAATREAAAIVPVAVALPQAVPVAPAAPETSAIPAPADGDPFPSPLKPMI